MSWVGKGKKIPFHINDYLCNKQLFADLMITKIYKQNVLRSH